MEEIIFIEVFFLHNIFCVPLFRLNTCNLSDELRQKLLTLSEEELSSFVLMEKITPSPQKAAIIRSGEELCCDTICELGVFGLYLRNGTGKMVTSEYGGYLLRVKPVDADEGGVAAG